MKKSAVRRHNLNFLFKYSFYARVIHELLLWFGLFLSVKHATNKINSKQTKKQKYLYKCPTLVAN
jgi:hypothetical protein